MMSIWSVTIVFLVGAAANLDSSLAFPNGGNQENESTIRAQNETISEVWIQTSICDKCGMTSFGSLSIKVCGRSDCCFKEDLDGSFNKGDLDKFTSEEELEQCNNFNVGTFGDNGEYLKIVLYHHGTDGGQFEFVDVLAGGGAHFRCPMPDVPIDDDEYQRSRYCKRL